jgi:DNA helicase-2/ATP-dependent DNA helicase PcrA
MEVQPKTKPKKLDLSKLNPEQLSAVLHVDGPLLILAGAGSGKTNTMTHRIAYLIAEKGIHPRSILGLSFTNKAANELKERVKRLTIKAAGPKSTQGLIVSTFHSLCVRILREYAYKVGYTPEFSILDPSDQESIVKEILRYIKIDEKKFDPSWVLFQIGQAKNKLLNHEEAAHFFDSVKGPKVSYDEYSIALQSVFPRYQERLKLLNAMDFDDLLFNAVLLLEKFPEVRKNLSERFRYILVDEYQDTNPSQFRLLQALTSTHNNICVVGDDDQSIYAWRGADPAHILHFDQSFPGTKKIVLDQNYRSTDVILKAANEVIAKNVKRYPKSLWSGRGTGTPIHRVAVEDDRAESQMVAEEIVKRANERKVVAPTNNEGIQDYLPWRDFAILYRSNSQSRIFEEALRLHQIPYKLVGALSFLDRSEVKNLLCYWKLVMNPKDDTAIRRVINWPARGIGKTSITLIHEFAVQHQLSFFEAMQAHEVTHKLNEKAKKGLVSFREIISSLGEKLDSMHAMNFTDHHAGPQTGDFLSNLSDWAKNSLTVIGAKAALQAEEEDLAKAQKRFENIEELASAIGLMDLGFLGEDTTTHTGRRVLQEYLGQLVLDSKDEKEKEEDPNALTLMTLHGAKGLEFPIVFLVGLEDGYLPHQRTIDEGTDLSEERRLFYVGITRARDELYLTYAKNRIRYGKAIPRNPCRFLEDIPEDLLLERDESSTPAFQSEEAAKKHEEEVVNFFEEIQKRLRQPKK